MNKAFEKILERLDETDFNDIQMVVREVLLKYGFPYESVVQDEVWDALDGLSTNKFTKKIVQEVAEEFATDTNVGTNSWIPCSERYPDNDNYVLLSFKNFSIPCVGRYEEDENGGAFYIGDEDESCVSQDMFVNAWQPLPEPYRESEQNDGNV